MQEMDGHSVLKSIRELEKTRYVPAAQAVKIIMTTALDDSTNVIGAFREGCEAYLVKPIERHKLNHELRKLGLIE